MSFNIDNWLAKLIPQIKETFKDEVLFIGLQGSYRRGEANPNSDIDVVVILEEATIENLKKYKEIILSMPDNDKACGFVSGRKEIASWTKSDLFQFKNDTKPLFKTMDGLVPDVTKEDVETFVKKTCADLYHFSVHSFIFDKDTENLKQVLKALFFVLQSVYYLKTGKYVGSKNELVCLLEGEEKTFLELSLNGIEGADIETIYDNLINYFSTILEK